MAIDDVSVGVAFTVLLVVVILFIMRKLFLAIRTVVPSGNLLRDKSKPTETKIPLSVNYHFTRQCNYRCGFCFHTAKTSFVLPLKEAKRGLEMLKAAGKFKYLTGNFAMSDHGRKSMF